MIDYSKYRKINNVTRQKSHRIIPTLLVGICIFLLVMQVFVSNRLATAGNKVTKVEQNIERVAQGNIMLREAIASDSSFMALKSKANSIGFTQQMRPVYLNEENTVALDLR